MQVTWFALPANVLLSTGTGMQIAIERAAHTGCACDRLSAKQGDTIDTGQGT
jgi:hypothetical protein